MKTVVLFCRNYMLHIQTTSEFVWQRFLPPLFPVKFESPRTGNAESLTSVMENSYSVFTVCLASTAPENSTECKTVRIHARRLSLHSAKPLKSVKMFVQQEPHVAF